MILGFTTGVPEDPENRKYTEEQVQQMFQVLDKNQFVGKRITYPVRAVLVGKNTSGVILSNLEIYRCAIRQTFVH